MMKAKTKRMILIIIQCALIAICISYFKLSNEIANVRYSEKGGHYFYSDGTVEDAPNIYYYKEFDNYFAVYHGKQLTYYAVSPGYTKECHSADHQMESAVREKYHEDHPDHSYIH